MGMTPGLLVLSAMVVMVIANGAADTAPIAGCSSGGEGIGERAL